MRSNICDVVSAFKKLENYVWDGSWTRTQFLDGFQKRVDSLRQCGVQLSDSYVALRLLTASNLDKLGETLVSIRCDDLTYSDVKSLITVIYKDRESEYQ